MQEPHAFHALFALHKAVCVAYIHSQQSDGTTGAQIFDQRYLLPMLDRLANDTPPPSRCSVLFEKPAAPPPAAGFFVSGPAASEPEIELRFLPALFGVER